MLTKDIMTVKVEGNQIVKIDTDILCDIYHPPDHDHSTEPN
jgi:hypothetical protein